MFKVFILALERLRSKPFVSGLLALQVFIAFLALNISIGQFQFYNYFSSIISNSQLSENDMYLTCEIDTISIDNDNERNQLNNKINNEIISVKNVENQSFAMNYSYVKVKGYDTNNLVLIGYDNALLKKIKLPLKQGEWFNTQNEKETVPIIIGGEISSKYTVGDMIESEVTDAIGKPHSYKFQVEGILQEPEYVLNFNMGGTLVYFSDFFSKFENVIITQQLVDDNGNILPSFNSMNRLIFPKEGISQEQLEECRTELNKFGPVTTIKEIENFQQDLVKNRVENQWAVNFLLILMAIFGMIGCNIIHVVRQMNVYSTYYLCGLEWTKCIILTIINIFIINIIPTLLAIIVLKFKLINGAITQNSIINQNNLIISMVLMMALVVFASMLPVLKMKSISPITLLRRHD